MINPKLTAISLSLYRYYNSRFDDEYQAEANITSVNGSVHINTKFSAVSLSCFDLFSLSPDAISSPSENIFNVLEASYCVEKLAGYLFLELYSFDSQKSC